MVARLNLTWQYRLGEHLSVRARSVLGGLHHEYQLAPASA